MVEINVDTFINIQKLNFFRIVQSQRNLSILIITQHLYYYNKNDFSIFPSARGINGISVITYFLLKRQLYITTLLY